MSKAKYGVLGLWVLTALLGSGCGQEKGGPSQGGPPRGTLITVSQSVLESFEVVQESVGWVESRSVPFVAAEVEGRVVRVLADVGDPVRAGDPLLELDDTDLRLARTVAQADVKRLQALVDNQRRQVERFRNLAQEDLVSSRDLEDAESQLTALREELASAEARFAKAEYDLTRTRVTSPVDGQIEERRISVGDYLRIGDPLFRIPALGALRIHLPFPESSAPQLRTGLPVRISTPSVTGKIVRGTIAEIRPMIGMNNRSLDVIVDFPNPGGWKPGASVNGTVILAGHRSVAVPEQSVVRRPAGDVVYVIRENKAVQQVVKTGVRREGKIEILSGLAAGETVAMDGTGFLTDGAPVKIQGKI